MEARHGEMRRISQYEDVISLAIFDWRPYAACTSRWKRCRED